MNYVLAFIIAFGLAYIITPFLRRLNGNVSIYFVTLIVSLLFLEPDIPLLGIFIIGAIVVFLGIIAEKRWLPSWTISLGLLLCSVLITLFGIKIDTHIHPDLSSILITALWLIFVIGAMSVISKIDGLTVYISLILCLTFSIISIFRKGDTGLHTTLCITFVGSLLGILRYNYKIKIGNASFLGFIIGALTIIGEDLKTATSIILSVPILCLCVPVLIVASSIIRPFTSGVVFSSNRKSLFGRMTTYQVVLFINLVSIAISIIFLSFIFYNIQISLIILLSSTLSSIWLVRKYLLAHKRTSDSRVSGQISILGIDVDKITVDKAIKRIDGFIKTNLPHMVVVLDTCLINHAQKDKELRNILKQADLLVPDGLSLIWAAEFYGNPLPERITGVDLMNNLCRLARDEGYIVYLLSGKKGGAVHVAKNLASSFEGLRIVGVEEDYSNKKEEMRIIKRINTYSPDILFVGLGEIMNEKWIKRNLSHLQVKVAIGAQEALDVNLSRAKRPPLYKVYSQPRRLIRFYNMLNFVFRVLVHKINGNQ